VFPLEILPWVLAFSALFHLGIALVILIAVSGWLHHGWPVSLLCLPLVWLPLLPLVGVGWLFSALGVFLKDINQLLGVVVSLLMFLSPIFYSQPDILSARILACVVAPLDASESPGIGHGSHPGRGAEWSLAGLVFPDPGHGRKPGRGAAGGPIFPRGAT